MNLLAVVLLNWVRLIRIDIVLIIRYTVINPTPYGGGIEEAADA